MPTVPTLEQPSVGAEPLPGRPFPRLSDEVSPAAFGTPVARGLEDISGVMSSEQARQKIQNDNVRVIDANTQLEAGRNAMLYGQVGQDGTRQGGAFSLHGTDAINLPAKLLPEYQKLAEKISSGLTPDQQRLFHGHVAAGSNELNLQLNRYEYQESNRLADEVYSNGVNQAIQSGALGYRDPFAIGRARADIKALVQLQADREGWTPAIRDQETLKAMGHLHAEVVASMLATGKLQTAQTYITQHLGELDPKDSESLQRRIFATEEHQLVMQEKQLKVGSDALAKEGDSLLAQGKLNSAWIEDHRHALSASEFRYFYKALSGTDESATNAQVYADLYLKAANGEDVRDDARDALTKDHTLSRSDFTKIAGLVDQERPGWFKRGTQFISNALDPGQLNPDPDAHLSRAYALQDWQEWASKHGDATDAQAREMQNELASHYRIVPGDKIALAMKAPTHLVGTRANTVDEQGKPDPMLNATVRRMKAALQTGQMTDDEAQEEAVLIQQYRRIYQAQQQAKTAKGAKP